MTCDFEPDGRNVIDDYLKRRGWKEPAPVRHYLEALRRSVMSLYEVVGTTPGRHFMARDLIRGGEPIQVKDKLASQSLAQWDRMAARMLPVGNEVHMAGGVVPLTFEDSSALLDEIRPGQEKLRPQRQAAGQAGGRPDRRRRSVSGGGRHSRRHGAAVHPGVAHQGLARRSGPVDAQPRQLRR